VGIFVDLEERMKIEKNLRETREQLLQSEKLAAMGRLTSQIAHELNNPLYGIMNTLELLKTEISKNSKRRKMCIFHSQIPDPESKKSIWMKFLIPFSPQKEKYRVLDWVFLSVMASSRIMAVRSWLTVSWVRVQHLQFSYLLYRDHN